MALGTTNISALDVANLLGASTDNVFLLATATQINKWSRFKPTRGVDNDMSGQTLTNEQNTFWKGADGNCGFDMPNAWNYLKPRGGSPGGSPDEPGRLGDFRGYEHNKANTDPPVYADYASAEMINGGDVMPTTSIYNQIAWQGLWRYGKNAAHDNIRILPSDIGLGSYYWGIKLVSPVSGVYYKTLNNLNDNATIGFDLTFTNPGAAGYTDFPQNWDIGQWNWYLFISSSSATGWTTSPPSNIIMLPTDSAISRLITSGHFHMLPYCVYGYTSGSYYPITALPKAGGGFPYTAGSNLVNYDRGVVNTNSGTYFVVNRNGYNWVHFMAYSSESGYSLATVDTTNISCLDGKDLRFYCDLNTGNERSADIYIGSNGAGGSFKVTINQLGHPPYFNHNPAWSPGWSSGPTATAASADTVIHITGTPNGFYSGSGSLTMYVWVKKAGTLVGSVLSFGAKDGTIYSQDIINLPAMDASTYEIYYDSVDRSGQ